ncbi:MAG TPA: DUF3822 family protein [Bacteroidia bacterium]|nr:DUF3822 family protein [Bacteroidia bacterium]HNU34682.1 DUF3822 family protein [Bacteroidia bacterium]
MINTEKALAPWISVEDESLNVTNEYDLYLLTGNDTIQFAILDNDRTKFVALHDYNLLSLKSDDIAEKVMSVILNDELLSTYKKSFRKVFISYSSSKNTLIPNAFYNDAEKKNLLSFNFNTYENEIAYNDKVRQIDAQLLYNVDKRTADFLNGFFSNTLHHNATNSLIEGIILQHKNNSETLITVNVSHTSFDLIITEGKKLIYYNSFTYQSTEDFMYYILFACEQMQLNPESAVFYFSGMIEKNSALYLLAQKYIRNIRFTQRPDFCEYSYRFNEVPSHYHYRLYNQYLCAL